MPAKAGKNIGAWISGCEGPVLTSNEEAFFEQANPWGLILFRRNCQSPQQMAALTARFREVVGRKDAPVLIDQEGGRVQRMAPATGPWRAYPPAAAFGRMYDKYPLHALRAVRNVGRLMALDLLAAGVTVNCIPVLDLPQPGASAIISDRAYSARPEAAVALARAHMAGFLEGGILPVMKHIPGHGRAMVDSHEDLPLITTRRQDLEEHDFMPFVAMADCPMAMTAHVVLTEIDPLHPATQSKRIVRDVIRKQLGFTGLLMTDDLSMKALRGTYAEKVKASLEAGVDILLHCNGELSEMQEVATAAGPLKGRSLARAKAALKHRRKPLPFDQKTALRDLDAVSKEQISAI